MAFVLEFMERLLEKGTSACLEEYLLKDSNIAERQFIQILCIFFNLFFIILHPPVRWLLRDKIIYDIICIDGKMVSLTEIGNNLAYEPGVQGMGLLPDGIIR